MKWLIWRMVEHLYIHIPFCPNICPYCAFYKESAGRERVETFLDALLLETTTWSAQLRPKTIFFGGGTPSALSLAQFEKLLGGLRERLDLSQLTEWTIEMNPATVALDKAALLREAGINRVSMGVQSWDDDVLRTLGRTHDADRAEESFHLLRQAGFDNLSIDLIFGIPGQSLDSWRKSLEKSLRLAPEHLSAYGLTNYARSERHSLHNMAYWMGSDYLGLGPSAFSTVGTRRWRNIRETGIYSETTLAGKTAIDFEEEVSELLKRREKAAFGMRTFRGLLVAEDDLWKEELSELQAQGLVEQVHERWLLTPRGRLLADTVAEIFV